MKDTEDTAPYISQAGQATVWGESKARRQGHW